MHRRSALVLALAVAVLPALWGCAGGSPYRDPEWPGYQWGGRSEERKADPFQVQQQLAALTAQLSADMRARQVQRIAVFPFENTSGSNPESLGAYLTEKVTNLFYADRVGLVVERTYLKKVIDEIALGHSGPFDPLSLKEVGHLLNADTLVLGSYTKLTNGATEVMARAVSVETGEIVGASSAMISGKIVPNVPIVVREPLLAKQETLPMAGAPTPPPQERRPSEPTQELASGTFNIVPSPAPDMAYSTPQIASGTPYPTYPQPTVVPPYGAAPNTGGPFYGYTPVWRPLYPFPSGPYLARPFVQPPFFSRPFGGHRGRRR